jgi:hypothetical protein
MTPGQDGIVRLRVQGAGYNSVFLLFSDKARRLKFIDPTQRYCSDRDKSKICMNLDSGRI